MKHLPLLLIIGVSGLSFIRFAPSFDTRVQLVSITSSLAGIDCPEDKNKPCADDEIRLVRSNPASVS